MFFESQLRQIVAESGVFLRREANALGYEDRQVQAAYRSGAWVRVRHGAYTFADIWDTANEIDRHRTHSRAVLRTHAKPVALSHASSIAERDIDMWGIDLSRTHLTRLDGVSGRRAKDVIHHEGTCPKDDVELVNGVPATVLTRATIETINTESVESGLVLTDATLRRKLVTLEDLDARHAKMADWPGAQRADLVLRLADARSESVGETRARYLMWQQALPMPDLQYDVFDGVGNLAGTTDFAWEKHKLLGEFDGKVKYGRLLRPGEDPSDAVFREKKREDLLRELTGWRFIRLVWADLYRPLETAARIRSMLRRAA
jgi:hypothetical protein